MGRSTSTLCCLSLALLLAGCPGGLDDDDATECVPVGTARLVTGPESSFIGPLSNPQPGDAYLAND